MQVQQSTSSGSQEGSLSYSPTPLKNRPKCPLDGLPLGRQAGAAPHLLERMDFDPAISLIVNFGQKKTIDFAQDEAGLPRDNTACYRGQARRTDERGCRVDEALFYVAHGSRDHDGVGGHSGVRG